MFDYVNYECVCPRCKNKVDGFQSKDGECTLGTIEPESVSNFYSSCGVCGAWIEFDVIPAKSLKFKMRPVSKERTKTPDMSIEEK